VGIEVEIVERNPARTGFVPIPKRWIVERAYGILMLHRRLVRDYEHLQRSSSQGQRWLRIPICAPPMAVTVVPMAPTAVAASVRVSR
jgi:hypothetical protein